MINFFRKTRKKLADDNKFLKYWRYAIGEIVLVVVGILIALSINNWNETRKLKKDEISILKSLVIEFEVNRNLIQSCQHIIREKKLYGDSIRNQIRPILSTLTIDRLNLLFVEIGSTENCNLSIDILEDIQGSGKLNHISNEEIRKSISKWSSYLKELEREENDWAQEFFTQFVPYVNKWIQWDDVDYLFNMDDPRYFKSRFDIDPRLILQNPEFSNIMAIHYWRMDRIEGRTELLLIQTNELLELLQKELKS